jgi:hypothetical protein
MIISMVISWENPLTGNGNVTIFIPCEDIWFRNISKELYYVKTIAPIVRRVMYMRKPAMFSSAFSIIRIIRPGMVPPAGADYGT